MKKALLIVFLLIGYSGYTQQDYQYSQYMSNLSYINPAYVGSNDFATVSGLFRKQWVKFDGAPNTGVITYETPFTKMNMGIGGIVSYDKIGVSKQLNVSVNYAYHLDFGNSKLSLGLNAGILHYSANLSSLTIWDEQDIAFANDFSGKVIPQFGFGTYYYSEKYFVGISIPRLTNINTENPININLNNSPSLNRHYYLIGGYNFDLSDDIILKSSTLIKYVKAAPLEAEITALAEYKELYSIGVSFRTGDCISPILQYKIKDFAKIGYSYDVTISKMRGYSNGSHEILLSYIFKGKEGPKASIE